MTTFNIDGHIAKFWESYQVTENLPQSRQIIGRWRRRRTSPAAWNPEFPFQAYPQENVTSEDVKPKQMKFGVVSLSSDERVKWRRDLSGLHLKCVTIQSYPLTILHHQEDGSMKEGGVLHSLMRSLARQLNFTYSCHEVADKQWGTYSEGKWTGMIGEVLYGKADIAVAPLDITLLRSQAVDYVIPLVDSGYRMIMTRPNTQDVFWTVYTRLFPAVLWSCVVSTTALMMVLLVLAKRNNDLRRHLSFLDSFTAIVRYGCGQGNDLQLYHTSERLMAFLAQMFFKFLGAYYTCFLVSSLAAGPPEPKLVSLQDVLETSMTLGVVEGTAPVEYFKESPDHLHRKVWQSLQRKNYAAISPNLETAMRRVRTEPYVLMEWDVHLKYKYESDCQLFILPNSYFQAKSSIVLRKGSPYVALLNSVILEMLESGILEKWSREMKRKRQDQCNVEINPVEFKTNPCYICTLTSSNMNAVAHSLKKCKFYVANYVMYMYIKRSFPLFQRFSCTQESQAYLAPKKCNLSHPYYADSNRTDSVRKNGTRTLRAKRLAECTSSERGVSGIPRSADVPLEPVLMTRLPSGTNVS
ncbi:probable glutamate receptor [Palaemon carinicauda]|uniref:probable glutamate receptor n=1 Tax=Palaemon carinicauda TaxID=392227 RepID=UPI0035B5F05E